MRHQAEPAPVEPQRRCTARLQEIFSVDPFACPACRGPMRLVAFNTAPSVITHFCTRASTAAPRGDPSRPLSHTPTFALGHPHHLTTCEGVRWVRFPDRSTIELVQMLPASHCPLGLTAGRRFRDQCQIAAAADVRSAGGIAHSRRDRSVKPSLRRAKRSPCLAFHSRSRPWITRLSQHSKRSNSARQYRR